MEFKVYYNFFYTLPNYKIFYISYRSELKYFSRMTKKRNDLSKENVVIMGRKTFFGVPKNKRPLPERINVVLSRNPQSEDYPESVVLCRSLPEAMEKLSQPEYSERIENIWIVGGSSVYKEAMDSAHCHRLYFTSVKGNFECDTFFPHIPHTFQLVKNDDDMPTEVQEENGIKYEYKINEKYD